MSSIHIPTFVTSNTSTDHHPNCKWATDPQMTFNLRWFQYGNIFSETTMVIVQILYNVVYLQKGLQQFLNNGTTL